VVAVALTPEFDSMAGALAYLYQRPDLERSGPTREARDQYKLDRMQALVERLGNPQDAVRTVHVAGTKGKGSTCEMTAAMLEGCGYTVGIYTSPHLSDVRERVRINRKLVSEVDFVRLAREVGRAAQALEAAHGPATFFELTTAMALVHFAQQAVDIAVIEVGLGGLLDCTNVIMPEVAAVATIGFDHMEVLGRTLVEIATQKGGIYKPGVPALAIQQGPEVLGALRACATRVGAPFQVVGEDLEFSFRMEYAGAGGVPQAYVQLSTPHSEYDFVPVPLVGEHQALNCGLALGIIDKLTERGFQCPPDRAVQGLATTRLAGRFELVQWSPRVLFDGAHNPESVKLLMRTVAQYASYDALVVVFGCAADKDARPMLEALAGAADKVIFTRASDNKRAADPHVLYRMYQSLEGPMSMVEPSLPAAMELARRSSNLGDLMCVTGSFYVVGEARRWLGERLKSARR